MTRQRARRITQPESDSAAMQFASTQCQRQGQGQGQGKGKAKASASAEQFEYCVFPMDWTGSRKDRRYDVAQLLLTNKKPRMGNFNNIEGAHAGNEIARRINDPY